MRRHSWELLVFALVLALSACNGVFAYSSDGTITATGTVSIVQLTVTSDGVQITIVTLLDGRSSQTLNFCGNNVSLFQANSFVSVDYTHSGSCENVIRVR